MPRQARLETPDTFHPVMMRGTDRTARFRDDTDRVHFVARLAALRQAARHLGVPSAAISKMLREGNA